MHAALRPYVTTGVALVGASVIAVTPTMPTSTDLQMHSPAVPTYQNVAIDLVAKRSPLQVYTEMLKQAGENTGLMFDSLLQAPAPILAQIVRNLVGTGQHLTSAFSDAVTRSSDALRNEVPELLQQAREQFNKGDVSGGVDSLVAALAAPLTPFNEVGDALAQALGQPFATVGRVITALTRPEFVTGVVISMIGPVISTIGATGVAIRNIFDALGSNDPQQMVDGLRRNDPKALMYALAVAPATILDGLLNGGYGPDLSPLLGGTTKGDETAAFIARGRVLAGGLLSPLQQARTSPDLAAGADLANGDRILPGPIGGIQAVRLTVARAIRPQDRFIAANDADVASGNSVTLSVVPADSLGAPADQGTSGTPKAQTDGNAKQSPTLGPKKLSERVGKHRKADAASNSAK